MDKENTVGMIDVSEAELAPICRRHRIRKLSLFGSQLKGTARPDSDVDLLVEFLPDARPTYFDLANIEIELSALLDGRKVAKLDLDQTTGTDSVDRAAGAGSRSIGCGSGSCSTAPMTLPSGAGRASR